MHDEYSSLFNSIKDIYPDSYHIEIKDYINNLKQSANHYSLVKITILSAFRENYKNMIDIFPKIYCQYQNTSFCVSKLSKEDIDVIVRCYIEEVENIGKEFI